MTHTDDEFGRQVLAPLKITPPLDPQVAAAEKARYLMQAESLRLELAEQPGMLSDGSVILASRQRRPRWVLKSLLVAFFTLLILISSSLTVYAAQQSLPGETLYPLKLLGEDIQLSLTRSPHTRLDRTLANTERRVDEITQLLSSGKPLPSQTLDRYQGEMENALRLAAQMEDIQLQRALGEIKSTAENQGKSIEELINQLPDQAEPAILRLQDRLEEQVNLSASGEADPQAFRLTMQARHRRQQESTKTHQPGKDAITTPATAGKTEKPIGNDTPQPPQPAGPGGNNPGQGNPDPGGANHGPEPSKSPKP